MRIEKVTARQKSSTAAADAKTVDRTQHGIEAVAAAGPKYAGIYTDAWYGDIAIAQEGRSW